MNSFGIFIAVLLSIFSIIFIGGIILMRRYRHNPCGCASLTGLILVTIGVTGLIFTAIYGHELLY